MKNYNVLIADDSVVALKYLTIAFKNAGFKVKTASDGYEALETAIKENIDLVVTDLNMPEMDGITLLKNLKENEDTKKIPVILISSNMPGNIEMSKSYAFLQKPFKESEIIGIANKAVEGLKS